MRQRDSAPSQGASRRRLELVCILFAAVTVLDVRSTSPYPNILVLGSLALSLTPGVPTVEPDLDIVFLTPITWPPTTSCAVCSSKRYGAR
jgi:hypothetical protein